MGRITFAVSSPPRLDFAAINAAARSSLPALLARWLPDGHRRGHEWVARNPRRADRNAGSFSVNMRTGAWGDFATGERGGDPISLAAFLASTNQADAARGLARMLGIE
ncbi:hypothetical protein IBL26_11825 [Roseomonas aerophila]|uniref:DNA primase n=1 Tax=Teichococcus aerophilus TaxID=1224513 RepID=A0ABR7RLW9_9PROT|nr:hypothetical protein [Pseudoroseomonas aerophila]MBC9207524.1 hypothetical protein [Pseudoroseomonas aerophila]